MSTFAILSDLHGCATALEKALAICQKDYKVDYYLLLGDLLYHGPRNKIVDGYDAKRTAEILNSFRSKIIAVRGNCDAEVDQMVLQFPIMANCNQIPYKNHRIFMTHGHLYDPETLPLSSGDLYLSGHTHRVVLEEMSNGLYCFNPGSISLPKEPSFGTFGILEGDLIKLIDLEQNRVVKELRLWQ